MSEKSGDALLARIVALEKRVDALEGRLTKQPVPRMEPPKPAMPVDSYHAPSGWSYDRQKGQYRFIKEDGTTSFPKPESVPQEVRDYFEAGNGGTMAAYGTDTRIPTLEAPDPSTSVERSDNQE